MPQVKVNYREGTCFFVPLREGGFARGLVARCDRKGMVFGYFFGPRLDDATNGFQLLSADDAILVGLCGDPGLLEGSWPLAGEVEDWSRKKWPFPPLFREDEGAGKAWLSYYDEDTLDFIREEPVSPESRNSYPYDRVMGYGAVEIRLTRLLS